MRSSRRAKAATAAVGGGLVVGVVGGALITGSDEAPFGGLANEAHAAFPGAPGKIVFDRYLRGAGPTERKGVFTVNADGKQLRRLTSNGRTPSWSATGQKIVFIRNFEAGKTDIYTMNANGKQLRRLTSTPARETEPAWSPDGKQIVFTRASASVAGQPPGPPDVYKINATGKQLRRLTRTPDGEKNPVWSPTGEKIGYWRFGGDPGVFTMKPDGSGTRKLTSGNSPDWYPDGKAIAFTGREDKIFAMTATGKELQKIGPEGNLLGYSPAWSPDGDRIVFVGARKPGAPVGIFRMDADGTNVVRLTVAGRSGDFGENDSNPDWQPR